MTGNRMKIRPKTIIFAVFMAAFLGFTAYMTYYSNVAYYRNLPVVEAVMPLPEGINEEGRYNYMIPEAAIYLDAVQQPCIRTARYESSLLGEKYIVLENHIRILERCEDGMVLVEGLIRVEPVLTKPDETVLPGMAVRIQ